MEYRKKSPCKKDCQDRHGGCHAVCELYLEYEAYKQVEYKRRLRDYNVMAISPARERQLRAADQDKRQKRRHYR